MVVGCREIQPLVHLYSSLRYEISTRTVNRRDHKQRIPERYIYNNRLAQARWIVSRGRLRPGAVGVLAGGFRYKLIESRGKAFM